MVYETFYGRFYGFSQIPFHITPDPAMLFATETHHQALATLEYGITAGKGFIVLTGEAGVGKTTVLRGCLDRLDEGSTKIIYLFDPVLTVVELFTTLVKELGGRIYKQGYAEALRRLQKALLAAHAKGIQVVVAVDEAQNMPEQTLEGLRMLSNLETSTAKLIQIILVGQPELEQVLSKHSLRQLAQRIAVRARLDPLTWRQTQRYIEHRVCLAGRSADRPLFTRPALWYLAAVARGIPRSVNILCDNALINGYGHGSDRITLRIAREACHPLRRRFQRSAAVRVAVAAALVAVAVIGVLLRVAVPNDSAAVAGATGPSDQALVRSGEIRRTDLATATRASSVIDVANAAPLLPPGGNAVDTPLDEGNVTLRTGVATKQAAQTGAAENPGSISPRNTEALAAGWKWRVRRGDTVSGVCKATYNSCGAKQLHDILASNPWMTSEMRIHAGEIVMLPAVQDSAAVAHSN